jgi:hypothetical protein
VLVVPVGPGELRKDFARFRFLLGVTDGKGLFAPHEPGPGPGTGTGSAD